jgi:hypothetical protein
MQLFFWSGGLVFDDKVLLKYLELKYDEPHYIFEPILEKIFFDYSLGGYSHRER